MRAIIDENHFVSRLGKTLASANSFIVKQLNEAGLKDLVPSHGDILLVLFAQKSVSMQELSRKIHRDPSTVTTLVKKLVKAGYVQTQKNDEDKRKTEVCLTRKGKGLEGRFDAISQRLVSVQMEGIDASDFAITCKTLEKIRDNFTNATNANG